VRTTLSAILFLHKSADSIPSRTNITLNPTNCTTEMKILQHSLLSIKQYAMTICGERSTDPRDPGILTSVQNDVSQRWPAYPWDSRIRVSSGRCGRYGQQRTYCPGRESNCVQRQVWTVRTTENLLPWPGIELRPAAGVDGTDNREPTALAANRNASTGSVDGTDNREPTALAANRTPTACSSASNLPTCRISDPDSRTLAHCHTVQVSWEQGIAEELSCKGWLQDHATAGLGAVLSTGGRPVSVLSVACLPSTLLQFG
jgi:hypothetical protein